MEIPSESEITILAVLFSALSTVLCSGTFRPVVSSRKSYHFVSDRGEKNERDANQERRSRDLDKETFDNEGNESEGNHRVL